MPGISIVGTSTVHDKYQHSNAVAQAATGSSGDVFGVSLQQEISFNKLEAAGFCRDQRAGRRDSCLSFSPCTRSSDHDRMYPPGAAGRSRKGRTWPLIILSLCFAHVVQNCVGFSLTGKSNFKTTAQQPRRRRAFRTTSAVTSLRSESVLREAGPETSPSTEDASREQGEGEGFQWARQWYPVAVMRDLEARDPRQPYPVQLLGESLVVWKDPKDGGWKAFADRCPHRWAPLSEGRVDQKTGRLQCIYHGWEFQGDGKCGSIPQAQPEVRDTAQQSNRACATVIPTKVVQGKLWLFPDSSPQGVEASKHVEPALVPGLDLDNGDWGGNWYARDLAYGFDTLVENIADIAHIPFAHHGTIGNRALGSPMTMEMDEDRTGEDEFLTKPTGYRGVNTQTVGFKAPCLVYYANDYTEALPNMVKRMGLRLRAISWVLKKFNLDKRMAMEGLDRDPNDRCLFYFIGYAVPTSPGQSRVFTRSPRNFFLQHPVIPRRWRNSLAKEHLQQHLVLDGDSMALHVLERSLADAEHQGVKQPERTFYMPTETDLNTRAFRRWYNSRGGGGPTWAKGTDPSDLGPVLPREAVLDRWNTHTEDCAACGKAYRVSGQVKKAAIAGVLVLLGGAAAAPRGVLALGLAGGALASGRLAAVMAKRQQQFVFLDYVHYNRD